VFDLLGLAKELHEAADLGSQNHRHQWLYEVIDGTQGIRRFHWKAGVFKGSDEDNGCMPRFLATANELGRFEAIQTVHLHV